MRAFSPRYGENNEGHAQRVRSIRLSSTTVQRLTARQLELPNSRHIVDGELGELPASPRARLVRENVAKLYDIPIPVPVR